MKLSKDEARILAEAVRQAKYEMAEGYMNARKIVNMLQGLEDRLEEFGQDKRRQGRKSANDYNDLIKRLTKNK